MSGSPTDNGAWVDAIRALPKDAMVRHLTTGQVGSIQSFVVYESGATSAIVRIEGRGLVELGGRLEPLDNGSWLAGQGIAP